MIDVFLWIMLILQVYNIHFEIPSFYELIKLSIVVCTMLNLEVSIE